MITLIVISFYLLTEEKILLTINSLKLTRYDDESLMTKKVN